MGYSNTSAIMYMNVHMNEYIELFKRGEQGSMSITFVLRLKHTYLMPIPPPATPNIHVCHKTTTLEIQLF